MNKLHFSEITSVIEYTHTLKQILKNNKGLVKEIKEMHKHDVDLYINEQMEQLIYDDVGIYEKGNHYKLKFYTHRYMATIENLHNYFVDSSNEFTVDNKENFKEHLERALFYKRLFIDSDIMGLDVAFAVVGIVDNYKLRDFMIFEIDELIYILEKHFESLYKLDEEHMIKMIEENSATVFYNYFIDYDKKDFIVYKLKESVASLQYEWKNIYSWN